MAPEIVKIVTVATVRAPKGQGDGEVVISGTLRAAVPEGFFDKMSPEKQIAWAENYVREMTASDILTKLNLDQERAAEVRVNLKDIFGKPIIQYIQREERETLEGPLR